VVNVEILKKSSLTEATQKQKKRTSALARTVIAATRNKSHGLPTHYA